MCTIDFSFVPGSVVYTRELLDIIDVIDYIDWSEVSLCQGIICTRHNDLSQGSTSTSGDLVWIDPYSRSIIGYVLAHDGSRVFRMYSDDLPTGFDFL